MSRYEVWAPYATHRVDVQVGEAIHELARCPDRDGWWTGEAPEGDYSFRLDGGPPLPDPRSPRQPHGPDGPSRAVDHAAFRWSRTGWHGRALPGAVLYELHVGTFTARGTFDAAAEQLDHLVELGVDFVELMPVCPFPGRHGWGYDGVSLWAVHEPYGGPEGLKRFVDAAHRKGLGVVLDVVHNHLGPSGNHLPAYGPYFTDRHHTPWGSAVNLDAPGSDEVRAYLIGSALAWLRDYRIDGLRLDAVHALADDRAVHFLEELSHAVERLAVASNRPLFLIAESDLNSPRTTDAREAGGQGLTAQWSDDFHHALHCALTGESQGYYGDFARQPLAALAKTLRRGFFHDGTWSSFRERTHGRPFGPGGGHRLLGYLQTHDQVGNRALGDRISTSLPAGRLACGAALVLTSPFTPMLFMGEEWGAATPWQYFTDHTDPDLAEAVRQGRRREFAEHGWAAEAVPDPQEPATVLRSVLDWTEARRAPHAELLGWYRTLIRLRRERPELADPDLGAVRVDFDEAAGWLVVHRGPYRVAVNLGRGGAVLPLAAAGREVVAAFGAAALEGGAVRLDADSVAVVST
ncbi:malto-oligosyltrehalose trehalohydrolase [Kitasatospora aureofaciens]|uniref:Malto-oligosyltrehalose trehalohydrolase n=1 Tax=Kitasatospora aureofaciens TaxID=1894 RepID=A0A1E7N4Q2_KITAU|nr:malto-oligosyltrehalose trehalohydrolase [Kitasatospora aureofaciens]OEV35669.1 malto-oligosyltrehalose trehalohydrolase [Kitasatospora aureofaciens]GGU62652.1 malto-oligosyltrehalose trehalohydrolase [Kitasatospora aureofaciens]